MSSDLVIRMERREEEGRGEGVGVGESHGLRCSRNGRKDWLLAIFW